MSESPGERGFVPVDHGEHTPSDEIGVETNPCNDDSRQTQILAILDDPKDAKKGRQKDMNSLREVGVMTIVKRSSAAGQRVEQTRWVDRGNDGCVKSSFVLSRVQACTRAHSTLDVCTDTIDAVSENNVGCEFA